jgi:hypothetical protein
LRRKRRKKEKKRKIIHQKKEKENPRKNKSIMFKVLEQTEFPIGLNNSKGITEVSIVSIRIMRKSTNLVVESRLSLLFLFPFGFLGNQTEGFRKANYRERQEQIEYSQTAYQIAIRKWNRQDFWVREMVLWAGPHPEVLDK